MGAKHKEANYSKVMGTSLDKNIYTDCRQQANPNAIKCGLMPGLR
jgi:hypothetical protein